MLTLKNENRSVLIISILIAASFYFNILPYVIRFLDVEVISSYYTINTFEDDVYIASFLVSMLFFVVTSTLLYIYHLSGSLSKNISYDMKIPIALEFFLVLLVLYLTKDFMSQSRDSIKSSSNLLREVLIITTMIICSYHILVKDDLRVSFARFLFIAYVAMAIFEREFVLFAVLPVLLKVKITPKNLIILIVSSSLMFVVVMTYKELVNYTKNGGSAKLEHGVIYTLGVDTIHKMSLELSFISGIDVPDYQGASLVAPYQIPRLIDPERTTNSRLATEYYTDFKTGTGFSNWLEGFLNFGLIGIIVMPVILICVVHFSTAIFGQILLVPILIFAIKLNRAELWPLLISLIILPSLIFYFISKLRASSE